MTNVCRYSQYIKEDVSKKIVTSQFAKFLPYYPMPHK